MAPSFDICEKLIKEGLLDKDETVQMAAARSLQLQTVHKWLPESLHEPLMTLALNGKYDLVPSVLIPTFLERNFEFGLAEHYLAKVLYMDEDLNFMPILRKLAEAHRFETAKKYIQSNPQRSANERKLSRVIERYLQIYELLVEYLVAFPSKQDLAWVLKNLKKDVPFINSRARGAALRFILVAAINAKTGDEANSILKPMVDSLDNIEFPYWQMDFLRKVLGRMIEKGYAIPAITALASSWSKIKNNVRGDVSKELFESLVRNGYK